MDNASEMKTEDTISTVDDSYLNQLLAESKQLDPSLTLCHQLLDREIARVRASSNKFIDLFPDTKTKVSVDVRIPAKEHPQFNFVGKILGPKGNSLKRLQEETRTRISVLGRGSVRDKNKVKEEELRKQGGKFAHLNEELHVHIEAVAHPVEGYYRLSHALDQLQWHLEPDYSDDISRSQVQELAFLNGKTSSPVAHGRGQGFAGRAVGSGRGRGGPVHTPQNMGDFSGGFAPIMSDASRNHGVGGGPGPKAFVGTLSFGRGVLRPTPQSY